MCIRDRYNYYYRNYYPIIGRWLATDPLFKRGSLVGPEIQGHMIDHVVNLYRYCNNSPVDNIDILGFVTLHGALNSLGDRGIKPEGPLWSYTEKQIFNEWHRLEQLSTDWKNDVIECPDKIKLCYISIGEGVEEAKPVDCDNGKWSSLTPADQNYHPGAAWCMRSNTNTTSGQQCCYDADGELIKKGIAAGTPDRKAPDRGKQTGSKFVGVLAGSILGGIPGAIGGYYANSGINALEHLYHDVFPFWAAGALDNPGVNNCRDWKIGKHLTMYLDVRRPSPGKGECYK